jgi:hypothetical protein
MTPLMHALLSCLAVTSSMAALATPTQATSATAAQRTWPRIQPVTATYAIDFERGFTLELPLRDGAGRIRYLLACRAGRPGYMDTAPTGDGGNWTGDLMCTLNAGRTSTNELSLLSDDGDSAWHSRGVFELHDLTGACAAYPEFGRHRSFRVRGMRVSLRVDGVLLTHANALRAARLRVDAVPDAGAIYAQAAQSGYRNPGLDGCGTIRRGNDTRMCRNAVANWEVCPGLPATGVLR